MIFRPSGKSNLKSNLDGNGWRLSEHYSKEVVKNFSDNADGTAKIVTNSVPSPYARMFLFKQAFEYVNENSPTSGDSIYHYLVSHCLDVFELLFNKSAVPNQKLQLVRWNFYDELHELTKENSHQGHQLLGNTLRLYRDNTPLLDYFTQLGSDEKAAFSEFFFIIADGKVVAGTSPFTGLYTTENELPDFGMDLFASKESRTKAKSLVERSEEFQRYMYGLRENHKAAFVRNFKALDEYIGKCLDYNGISTEEMKKVRDEYKDHISAVEVSANNPVSVCGVELGQKSEKQRKEQIQLNSDFVIQTDDVFQRYSQGKYIPLALIDGFSYPWIYTDKNQRWESHYRIDRKQLNTSLLPVQDRTLPHAVQYPFITVEDFLEDHLLRLPTEVHAAKYRTGTYNKGVDKNYLPPIKKEYFDYFTPDTLTNSLRFDPDKVNPDAVVVSLDIPVKGGRKITFQKTYYPPMEKSIPERAGYYYQADFTVGIFPFYKTDDPFLDSDYRVMLLHRGEASLSFWARPEAFTDEHRPNKILPLQNLEQLVEKYDRSEMGESGKRVSSAYYRTGITFDFIEVRYRVNSGIEVKGAVLPNWPKKTLHPDSKSVFAIDFGTTNTHIAYRFEGADPKPFSISEADMQVAMLDLPNEIMPGGSNYERFDQLALGGTYSNLYRHEFIPAIIGVPDSVRIKYKFPTRSLLVEDKGMGMDGKTAKHRSLQNINIDFAYEVHPFNDLPLKVHHNLKWSFDNNLVNTERIKGYIEQLMLMVRTKAILNGYHPKNVEIRWFYPLSLTANHRDMLTREWNGLYQRLFNKEGATTRLNESEAPYFWHRRDNRIKANDHVLSIDIGGGTSDIVYIFNHEIIGGTSYRYAGNALFGNGLLKVKGLENGLAKYYHDVFDRTFPRESISHVDIRKIFDEIRSEDSEVLVNYFFSCQDFKFAEQLMGDKHFKLSILLHFTATLWHTAQWVRKLSEKSNNTTPPDIIALGGNASRLIDIILNGNPQNRTSPLNKLAANIFKKVFKEETKIPDFIPFVVNTNPKELTCLGGLSPDASETADKIRPNIYMGTTLEKDSPLYDKLIYEQISKLTKTVDSLPDHFKEKEQMSDEEAEIVTGYLKASVVQNVVDFISFFEEQIEIIDFDHAFGASKPLEINLKSIFSKKKMEEFLYEGILQMKNIGMEPAAKMNQTLFFLPIIGGLHELNEQLYQIKVKTEKT